MKNFFYFILALLCALIAGGVYVVAQDTMKTSNNSQEQTSVNRDNTLSSTPEDSSVEEEFINGEKRLKNPEDFELNRWYRF